MGTGLIIGLSLLGVVLFLFIGWIGFSFHPSKSSIISVGDEKLSIYCIRDGMVNFYVIQSGQSLVLIDTGTGKEIVTEFQKLNLDLGKVSAIFLTHSDYDHDGGVPFMPEAEIFLHPNEVQMINGTTSRFKKTTNVLAAEKYTELPPDSPLSREGLFILPIPTPGHTPGHTAYLVNDRYLFTGDTARLGFSGNIISFMRFINMDTATQLDSNRKLNTIIGSRPIKLIGTAHSGYKVFNIKK